MSENGFTTQIVHSDRRSGSEHGAIHEPVHVSTEYAYTDAHELAAVFQGKAGYTYARQGTPTTSALELQVTRMEQGEATRSEEHTSELQSLMRISYAVFCLKKTKKH